MRQRQILFDRDNAGRGIDCNCERRLSGKGAGPRRDLTDDDVADLDQRDRCAIGERDA